MDKDTLNAVARREEDGTREETQSCAGRESIAADRSGRGKQEDNVGTLNMSSAKLHLLLTGRFDVLVR